MSSRTPQQRPFRFALGFLGLAATACGGSDETAAQGPPPPSVTDTVATHQTLRRGHDVLTYCAAKKGALTAIAAVEATGATLYTSTSAALEEASFVAGPELTSFDGLGQCQLAAAEDGFALAWAGNTPDGAAALVQRLADDGTPRGEPLPIASTSRERVALAVEGERLFVGRVAGAGASAELWLDRVEGDEITSELVATCAVPSVPVLLPSAGGVDVLYVCGDEETAELILSQASDGERVTSVLESAATSLGEPALSALDRGDHFAVIWATSAATAFPPLLLVDKQTLELTEREFSGLSGGIPWELALLDGPDGPFLRANVCQEQMDDGEIPCGVELCAPGSRDEAGDCSAFELDNSARLLPRGSGVTLAFLEFGDDGGGDLFTAALEPDLSLAAAPLPVVGPGRLDPLAVACEGEGESARCTVFGSEDASHLETAELGFRADARRYGFWTTAEEPGGETDERVVLEASHRLIQSEIWGFDWSVGAVFMENGAERFAIFDPSGERVRHSDLGSRDPRALFHEHGEGVSRYRLFDLETTLDELGGLYLTTLDESGAGPASRVAPSALELVGRCGSRYVGVDSERRLHAYDPDADTEFQPGASLPELPPSEGELVRCLGQRIAGVSYGENETLLYREQPDGGFQEWRFSGTAEDWPGAGAFRAAASELADGRLVFVLHPGVGFGVPLVALALGESGEFEAFELELPEGISPAAAAMPARQPPGALVLAWSHAATRETTLSTFALP